jgi:hypothetical protein
VRHHLKHNISREECSAIFVRFAARGSLAQQNPWSAWERPGDRVRLARAHLVCVYFGSFWRPINQRWPMMAGGLGTRGPGG